VALIVLGLLIGVPVIEIAVFIKAGEIIGLGWTLAVIVLTAIAGTTLLRWQGLGVLARAQAALDRGEMPVAEVFDGLCLLLAGIVLLTPGFVTDAIGILLFIPPLRRLLGHWLLGRVLASGQVRFSGRGPGQQTGGPVIDGEFREVADDEPAPPDNGGGNPWTDRS